MEADVLILSSRIRKRVWIPWRRLTDDQVKNIARRSSVNFVNDDGNVVDGQVCEWRPELRGARAGQLGLVVVKPDDGSRWFFGIDPVTHEVQLIQRLAIARCMAH
jgi:hypothetical protein